MIEHGKDCCCTPCNEYRAEQDCVRRVYIAQLLCPTRHCVVALAGEFDTIAAAEAELRSKLQDGFDAACREGMLNRECAICKSRALHIEVAKTVFRSMDYDGHNRLLRLWPAIALQAIPALQQYVEMLGKSVGEYTIITVGKRSWRVQRHYLALHGLRAKELPELAKRLNFEEVTHARPA